MKGAGHVAVIDIGKTNAKVVLVTPDGVEVAMRRMPNRTRPGPPYPHFDVPGLWKFILDSLRDLAPCGIDTIVPVTHGACAALVDGDDALVLPVLDYEHDGPDAARSNYAPPPFAETGSPPLPGGLNLGAQIHWLAGSYPAAFARARWLLLWPQYWGMRLTGVTASEVTSLGCHTDLWAPHARAPSTLARERNWDALLPPVRSAGETLGTITDEVVRRTGLDRRTSVLTGIHDSNASLLPYLNRDGPCGVLSTGTWVVGMSLGAPIPTLDPDRGQLLNVDAFARPVASIRFMGGRDRDTMLNRGVTASDADAHVATKAAHEMRGIGAKGPIHVEGPFARSDAFLKTLWTESGGEVRPALGASGTTCGAALLVSMKSDHS